MLRNFKFSKSASISAAESIYLPTDRLRGPIPLADTISELTRSNGGQSIRT